ncbi:MAG: carboxymuconolactone decarboxylase family protein [Bacteroidota bacterium]
MSVETKENPTDLFTEFRKLSPKVTGGLLRMREEAYADGILPGKHKVLTALAISVAIRCEPCIRAYAKMALERGATKEELMEFLNVAITMQGCPGEEWALKAYAAYQEFAGGKVQPDGESCCSS